MSLPQGLRVNRAAQKHGRKASERLLVQKEIIRQYKTWWTGHVARMGEMRHIQFLVGKSEGTRSVGRPMRRCEDNIGMNLCEIEWKGMDWMHLARDRDRCEAHVNTLMNLRVPQKAKNFLTS